jgi:hypothetical protein
MDPAHTHVSGQWESREYAGPPCGFVRMAQFSRRFLQSDLAQDSCTETQEEDEAGPGKVEDFDRGWALQSSHRKSHLQELELSLSMVSQQPQPRLCAGLFNPGVGQAGELFILLTCVLTTMGQTRSHDSWGEWICDEQHTFPQGNLKYLLLRWVRWDDPSELGSLTQKEIWSALWLRDRGADKVHDVHRDHYLKLIYRPSHMPFLSEDGRRNHEIGCSYL